MAKIRQITNRAGRRLSSRVAGLVLPNLHTDGFSFSWMDFTTLFGIGGIFIGFFWKRLSSAPLLPVNDPELQASIEFVNQ